MTDRYQSRSPSFSGPATSGFAVTPSDTLDLQETARALYIGAGGDLSVAMATGETVLLKAVPQGAILPVRAIRVHQSGTTASAIVALV